MSGDIEPEYVEARRALLDALDTLARHRDALILVGAQAIYLHVGEADMAVAPFTTDGDIALDPRVLGDDPRIAEAMTQAGFRLGVPPGIWLSRSNIQIDLLVPDAVGGAGRRAARLGVHGTEVARKTRGLEAALVDKSDFTIGALEASDRREHRLAVAGPAALLIAKLHKLTDRLADAERPEGRPKRLAPKDALDVLRILRGVPTATLTDSLKRLMASDVASAVSTEALAHLRTLFSAPDGIGSQLAAQSVEGLENPVTIAASCAVLSQELLARF